MGEESALNEYEKGNTDPLHAPRKNSTAERVDERPPEVAPVPRDDDELPHNDTTGDVTRT